MYILCILITFPCLPLHFSGMKTNAPKAQLSFLISVFRFRSGTVPMYRKFGGYCLFSASKLRISITSRIVCLLEYFTCRLHLQDDLRLHVSLSIHCLSLICCNILYPDETWERGLDLMFKSQASLLWSDREKVLMEEADTARRTKTITIHPALCSRMTALAVVGNVCE